MREFTEFLSSKGLRYTREREAIFKEVSSFKGHFDPDELFMRLRKKNAAASRASVYRTIPLLIEAGIIEEVERTDKHSHYELVLGRKHHDHMLCVGCGRVIEFYSEELERLQQRICKRESFSSNSHTLEIKGLCSACGG